VDSATLNTIISTSGAVIVGIAGMYISSNQLGRRIDDLREDFRDMKAEFHTFKDVVNSKFAALDLEIAKLMDRRNDR